jgi:hypothetical protein
MRPSSEDMALLSTERNSANSSRLKGMSKLELPASRACVDSSTLGNMLYFVYKGDILLKSVNGSFGLVPFERKI